MYYLLLVALSLILCTCMGVYIMTFAGPSLLLQKLTQFTSQEKRAGNLDDPLPFLSICIRINMHTHTHNKHVVTHNHILQNSIKT